MPPTSRHTRPARYRPPTVQFSTANEEDEEYEDDEKSEWSDDDANDANDADYDFEELQNRVATRFQPPLRSPHTHNQENGRNQTSDHARASRWPVSVSPNSPGGQAVPYGPYYPNTHPSTPSGYYGYEYGQNSGHQHYNPGHHYYPSSTPHFYASPMESIQQEIESLKLQRDRDEQEIEALKLQRDRDEKRKMEKQRAEESRRKKRQALHRQKRVEKQQEELRKTHEKMLAEIVETNKETMRQRDQAAELSGLRNNLLMPQFAAGPHGNGYGSHAQDSMMRRLELLERQSQPNRWLNEPGQPLHYQNDRHSVDELRYQLDNLKNRLYNQEYLVERCISQQQRLAGRFADEEYPRYIPGMPGRPMLQQSHPQMASGSYYQPFTNGQVIGVSRKGRVEVPRGRSLRRSSPHAAVFDEVEEPVENVESLRKNHNRRSSQFGHNYFPGPEYGDDVEPPAVVERSIDESQQRPRIVYKRPQKQHRSFNEIPEAKEFQNMRGATKYGNEIEPRRVNGDVKEYSEGSGRSSVASYEPSTPYPRRPAAPFCREAIQNREPRAQPFDQSTRGIGEHLSVPTPPPADDSSQESQSELL
ncbi:hypothetical protein F4808DRAFT_74832 [Astrocystis sublimbata]|nr:hypothetical protein F4808DRAFT_74832 [Astrocystis sublimbata]